MPLSACGPPGILLELPSRLGLIGCERPKGLAALSLINWEPFSGLLTSPYLRRWQVQRGYPDDESSFPQHRGLPAWRCAPVHPRLCHRFFRERRFGGTYAYIGPGVASLPDLDVDTDRLALASMWSLASPSCPPPWTMPRRPRPGRRSIRKPSLRWCRPRRRASSLVPRRRVPKPGNSPPLSSSRLRCLRFCRRVQAPSVLPQ